MKAAVYKGPADIVIEEVEQPRIGYQDILVKVCACGICGSDLHTYKDGLYTEPGQIMGHEFSGEVVQVGKGVLNIKNGDRITAIPLVGCRNCHMCARGLYYLCLSKFGRTIAYGLPGAFAEYVRVPDAVLNRNVYGIPDRISYEEAALIEPLSTGLHAVRLAQPDIAETALILGAGPIGLCLLQVLRSAGPSTIIVSEISDKRLGMAKKLGADLVVNPKVEKLAELVTQIEGIDTASHGIDVVIDCVGKEATFKQGFDMVSPKGTLVLVGLYGNAVPVDLTFVVQNEVRVVGVFSYHDEFRQSIRLIQTGKVDVKSLISHRFPLGDTKHAFDVQCDAEESLKVLIIPNL